MTGAISVYRERFRPSARLEKPHLMLALNAIAGESDEEGRYLFTSLKQAFANLRTGRPGKMPAPVKGLQLDPLIEAGIAQALACSVVGGPDTVRAGVKAFAERWGADELIVTSSIFDHAKRKRSLEITAAAMAD